MKFLSRRLIAAFGLLVSISGAVANLAAADATQTASVPAIDTNDRQAVIDLYRNAYLPDVGVDAGWTGNVLTGTAGTVSDAFLHATLRRINYYRAMSGVNGDITFDPAANAKCQQAALMSAAQQNISHAPPATWKFYTADAAAACASCDLHLDWQGDEGAGAIDVYMADDDVYNSAVGHRRWLVYAGQSGMGTGAVPTDGATHPGTNATWVATPTARPTSAPAVTSWPPAGYVPVPLVFRRWSFSYVNADLSKATVAVTKGGVGLPVTLETVQDQILNGVGSMAGDNTLVWELPGDTASAVTTDAVYTVTVSNILVNGAPEQKTYNVTAVPISADPGGGTTTTGLPMVSIKATKPVAHFGGKAGMFVVTRTGDLTKPLTVKFTTSGTADPASVYKPLLNSVIVPAGSASVKLKVAAVSGAATADGETVIVTLKTKAKPRYLIASPPGEATVTISATP